MSAVRQFVVQQSNILTTINQTLGGDPMSKLLKVLALLFSVALIAAACGNDDDSGGTSAGGGGPDSGSHRGR